MLFNDKFTKDMLKRVPHQKMPVVEFTEEFLISTTIVPPQKRVEDIAKHLSVSIEEAADINLLLVLPAITV